MSWPKRTRPPGRLHSRPLNNRDYTLRILPKANHAQFQAKAGSNKEMPTLQQFVPEYFSTIQQWLAARTALMR